MTGNPLQVAQTNRMLKTIKTQLKHFLGFVGETTKLENIKSQKYKDYYAYRKRIKPNVTNVTLINERATLGNLHKWGMEQGFLNQSQLPVWSEIRKNYGNKI